VHPRSRPRSRVRPRVVPARRLVRCLLPAVVVALVAAACEVQTTVTVDVEDDGSGTVEVAAGLDAAAVAELPDLDDDGRSGAADLAALVRTDDLQTAGWSVGDPDTDGDGTMWIRATRPFGTPAEADEILAQLTGPGGALRDLHVGREHSFGRTTYRFSGAADLSAGLEAFGDEGLAAALDGEALGEDAAAIEARIGRPLADAFRLSVTADLPGEATTWSPRLGDPPLAMAAESEVVDAGVVALVAVAALCVVALVGLLVVRAVRGARRAQSGS
jgi:hypothetical protein